METVHSIITIRAALLTLASIATLLLGLSYSIGNKENKRNGFWLFSLCLGVSGWAVSHSVFDVISINGKYILFTSKMLYATAATIPVSLFFLTLSIRFKDERIFIFKKIYLYILQVVFLPFVLYLLLYTDCLVGEPYLEEGLRKVTLGDHHYIFTIFIFVSFGTAFYHMLRHYMHADSFGKVYSRYIFLGTASAGSIGTYTNMVLPYYFGNFSFFWVGPTTSLLMVGVILYGVIKHSVLDIKNSTAQAYAYLIPIIALLGLFFVRTVFEFTLFFIALLVLSVLSVLLIKQISREKAYREKGEKLARYLANANARLRELDKQKTEFVSIASHQLRSPIAAIKGYTSLIIDGSYGEMPKYLGDPLNRILESGQRIGIMVDDFLNVTRIEQGRMSYDMQKHNVCELVNDVVEELQVVAEEKGIVLTTECDSLKEMFIGADEGKIKQIFSNLIDNAIKYTQEGSIHVSVKQIEPEHKVLIKIKDTGIGIDPDEVKNLFQKFNRASNANKTNVLGTGLGLYIAKEILKAHNGWVGVESEGIGKGSTFTVELPVYDERNYKLDKKEK